MLGYLELACIKIDFAPISALNSLLNLALITYWLQNYRSYPFKGIEQVDYICCNEPFAVSLYINSTYTCMAKSLKETYQFSQDQPDYCNITLGREFLH